MFTNASNFNQNLGNWNISAVLDLSSMLDNSGLSVENYDETLIGWSSQSLQNNINLGAVGLFYCDSVAERQSLIDNFNWTIVDEGIDPECESICDLELPQSEWPENIATFCNLENLTVLDLIQAQTTLANLWYETESSETPIPESTQLVNGEIYYVTNYDPETGCESERLGISVLLVDTPSAPTGSSIQTFSEEDEPTVLDLSVEGENIIWYNSSNDGSVVENSYILENNDVVYASQTVNGCECEELLAVTIQIEDSSVNDPPIISSTGSEVYCPQTQQNIVSSFDISDPRRKGWRYFS